MYSIAYLLLHTSQGISLVTYLSRVLGYLIIFAALGTTTYWSLYAIGFLWTAIADGRHPPD